MLEGGVSRLVLCEQCAILLPAKTHLEQLQFLPDRLVVGVDLVGRHQVLLALVHHAGVSPAQQEGGGGQQETGEGHGRTASATGVRAAGKKKKHDIHT